MQNAEQEFAHEELVPLVLIAAELDEPIELVAERLGEAVQLDDVGMRVVPAAVTRAFLAERAAQEARIRERASHTPSPVSVPAGISRPANADPSMSAFEVMLAADAERKQADPNRRISPTEEILSQRLGPPRKVVVDEETAR
jgi:hypothetical protein